jgi:hypothetical protein
MRKIFTGGFMALLLAALVGLALLASSGTAAGPSQYQYRKPALTLTVQIVGSQSYFNLSGTGYNSGTQPGGSLTVTCGGKKGSSCPPPVSWGPGPTDASGSFSFVAAIVDCGSNVRSALAVDANGVRSNSVRNTC